MLELRQEDVLDQFVITASGTSICFRDHGDKSKPALLLIAGLGEDLNSWGAKLVFALVSHGFRVITMDNRDVGRSSFINTPPPALWRQVFAIPRKDAYSLADMANDAIAVLDCLHIPEAHLVGRSMGGMIAQTIASSTPHRVLSLTSLYSTTGSRKVGQPAWSTLFMLCAAPPRNKADAVRAHIRITKHVAGTAYPIDEMVEANIAARAWTRCGGDSNAGSARQIQAIQKSGDRTEQLKKIVAPTLVIHGERDLLVAPSGGVATASAIRNAKHVVMPGMGHHIPQSLVANITRQIAAHALGNQQGEQ